jgi:DGQHR domain-containing protein
MDEVQQSISLPCLKVKQPLGEFFIASIESNILCQITDFDVRRMITEREIETYLGIQRPLNPARVKELSFYVNTADACFPTGVILAVDGVCAQYNEEKKELILSNYLEPERLEDKVFYRQIAKVLDGQHRIEGLKSFEGDTFQVNISVFIDIDIEDQAYIFSTVNLAQTKVNKSLVYDLFDLANSRSPQKTCHNIAVALDDNSESPFFHRVKRLGVATEGRFNETITQATFVQSLLPYITSNALEDRDIYLKNRTPKKATAPDLNKFIFRNLFIEGKDLEIADILWNYFDAVKQRWPEAWSATGKGVMLNKTNGFRALMRFLRPVYLYLNSPGMVTSTQNFLGVLNKIQLADRDFTIDRFKPGTSGESELYKTLLEESRVGA